MNDYPACMRYVGNKTYRCNRFGFRVQTEVLPIRCACPYQTDGAEVRRALPSVLEQIRSTALSWRTERDRTVEEMDRILATWKICRHAPEAFEIEAYAHDLLDRTKWLRAWGPKPEEER